MSKLVKKYSGGGAQGVIEVAFPEYSVSTGFLGDRRLGHSAAIAVDENTGRTRTGIYGRYDKDDLGMALREYLPDMKLTKKGVVSNEDLENYAPMVLSTVQKIEGADKVGDEVMLRYYPDVSYEDAVTTMQNAERYGLRNSDGTPAYYSWLNGRTCASYAHNIATGQNPSTPQVGQSSHIINRGNKGGDVITYIQNEGIQTTNSQNEENSETSPLFRTRAAEGAARIAKGTTGTAEAAAKLKAKHKKTQARNTQTGNTQNNVGVQLYRGIRNIYNAISGIFR